MGDKERLEALLKLGPAVDGDTAGREEGELFHCWAQCRNGQKEEIEILEFRIMIEAFGWTYGTNEILASNARGEKTKLMSYFNDADTAVYVKFKNRVTGLVYEATAGEFDLEEENDRDTLDVSIEHVLKVFYKDNDVETADWKQA